MFEVDGTGSGECCSVEVEQMEWCTPVYEQIYELALSMRRSLTRQALQDVICHPAA